MYKTLSVFLIASTAITPIALNAEQSFFKDKLPSIVKNIAQGVEDGDADAATKNEVVDYSLNAANSALDSVEDNIVATTPPDTLLRCTSLFSCSKPRTPLPDL